MSNQYLSSVIQNVTGKPATKDELAAVKDMQLNQSILSSNQAAAQAINATEKMAPVPVVQALEKAADKHYSAAEKREKQLKEELSLGKFSPIEAIAVVSLQKPELQEQLAGTSQGAALAGNAQSKGFAPTV